MPKSAQTTAQISHTSKVTLKILQARLQQYMNHELSDVQAGFRKSRGTRQRSNCQHALDHRKSREFQKNIYFCFIGYANAFDCVDHNKLCKILKEMGIPDHLTCLLRNLYAGNKQPLELDMEQQTGSKLGKEYVKAVYCHPAYLTSMQGTSCEMLDWKKHKLESRLLGEISITLDNQMTPSLCLEEELESLLMKEESEKVGLKFNIQKTKIMASNPITSWELDGETVETVSDFIWGVLQNHCRW